MPQHIEGNLLAENNDRFAIVVARFNDLVTDRLLDGAVDTLRRHGVGDEKMSIAHVPGSFEIPIVADRFAKTGKYAAVICLGAVIQGETTHHEYINHQVAAGIMQISRETGVPAIFGVLTCQTTDQALARAGGKAGNKGAEAALAAIETVNVLRQIGEK
ncbi:MAG: 6,7-dimethyl-8-ribityllumazine synthase [Planctomycetaceae bacterium]|jgi:6,7-dimethyl-8-ribityllumazine synthase|nr:6,7-dimethyl-8-ribityllumazine synthase [Planctomycetaceae bacterium]MBT6155134.1 6,7-dimethyl-8-ribityllumazine synthase [Planctomycetaceae bacterium]MBT6483350.1 6,7-dimethyl-8-ribityllumazine synthase [Planctomycetaceae bacterium]MBT6493855.1 6,7-dimethyl-8-ribityllumazine synthase [Planctomycetaceae bacterium]